MYGHGCAWTQIYASMGIHIDTRIGMCAGLQIFVAQVGERLVGINVVLEGLDFLKTGTCA